MPPLLSLTSLPGIHAVCTVLLLQVPDTARLITLLEEYLEDYNLNSTNSLNLGA